ncbi:Hypothetical Protein FCC1311_042852 [Hondaea fermentalgiana]|uniref:Myb-like domain-containing protein n=1 Tax=Hondaea fermentalgiana TaxID=2315210 RepID=A0A2R5GAM2_9STRA|nr:Hypothetical Protein FCC1311_042852 [Hondaea fermentalgiana]|eukprot:GBG28062.1 Hypothetical Protein FCC1311_042852 [Hondaea fermentalgiana]
MASDTLSRTNGKASAAGAKKSNHRAVRPSEIADDNDDEGDPFIGIPQILTPPLAPNPSEAQRLDGLFRNVLGDVFDDWGTKPQLEFVEAIANYGADWEAVAAALEGNNNVLPSEVRDHAATHFGPKVMRTIEAKQRARASRRRKGSRKAPRKARYKSHRKGVKDVDDGDDSSDFEVSEEEDNDSDNDKEREQEQDEESEDKDDDDDEEGETGNGDDNSVHGADISKVPKHTRKTKTQTRDEVIDVAACIPSLAEKEAPWKPIEVKRFEIARLLFGFNDSKRIALMVGTRSVRNVEDFAKAYSSKARDDSYTHFPPPRELCIIDVARSYAGHGRAHISVVAALNFGSRQAPIFLPLPSTAIVEILPFVVQHNVLGVPTKLVPVPAKIAYRYLAFQKQTPRIASPGCRPWEDLGPSGPKRRRYPGGLTTEIRITLANPSETDVMRKGSFVLKLGLKDCDAFTCAPTIKTPEIFIPFSTLAWPRPALTAPINDRYAQPSDQAFDFGSLRVGALPGLDAAATARVIAMRRALAAPPPRFRPPRRLLPVGEPRLISIRFPDVADLFTVYAVNLRAVGGFPASKPTATQTSLASVNLVHNVQCEFHDNIPEALALFTLESKEMDDKLAPSSAIIRMRAGDFVSTDIGPLPVNRTSACHTFARHLTQALSSSTPGIVDLTGDARDSFAAGRGRGRKPAHGKKGPMTKKGTKVVTLLRNANHDDDADTSDEDSRAHENIISVQKPPASPELLRRQLEKSMKRLKLDTDTVAELLCLFPMQITRWLKGDDDSQAACAVEYWVRHTANQETLDEVGGSPPVEGVDFEETPEYEFRVRLQMIICMERFNLTPRNLIERAGIQTPYVMFRWLRCADGNDAVLCAVTSCLADWYVQQIRQKSLDPAEGTPEYTSNKTWFRAALCQHDRTVMRNQQEFVQFAKDPKMRKYLRLSAEQADQVRRNARALSDATNMDIGKSPIASARLGTEPSQISVFPHMSRIRGLRILQTRLLSFIKNRRELDECPVDRRMLVKAFMVMLHYHRPTPIKALKDKSNDGAEDGPVAVDPEALMEKENLVPFGAYATPLVSLSTGLPPGVIPPSPPPTAAMLESYAMENPSTSAAMATAAAIAAGGGFGGKRAAPFAVPVGHMHPQDKRQRMMPNPYGAYLPTHPSQDTSTLMANSASLHDPNSHRDLHLLQQHMLMQVQQAHAGGSNQTMGQNQVVNFPASGVPLHVQALSLMRSAMATPASMTPIPNSMPPASVPNAITPEALYAQMLAFGSITSNSMNPATNSFSPPSLPPALSSQQQQQHHQQHHQQQQQQRQQQQQQEARERQLKLLQIAHAKFSSNI